MSVQGMINIIDVTERAAKEILAIRQQENIPQDHRLRVAIVGGGCSGFSYNMFFDNEQRQDDMIIKEHGVEILIDSKSSLYLSGTELDFSAGLNGRGFVFNNPNAARTCGCGSSFGV